MVLFLPYYQQFVDKKNNVVDLGHYAIIARCFTFAYLLLGILQFLHCEFSLMLFQCYVEQGERHSALCLRRGFPTSSWNAHSTALSFLQGFSHNFPDAAALRLVIVLTIFQALVGSTALNALSTSPIWYLIGCYSRFLYTACKSLLASILVTASGLLSSCGCEIPLLVFRFSFAGRLFLHCSSV